MLDLNAVANFMNTGERYLPLQQSGVVFAGGVFDVVHYQHVELLEWARGLGSELIVGLNSDESVKLLKGSTRPINTYLQRKRLLMALRCVSAVVPIEGTDPSETIIRVRPQIVVKGPGYDPETMIERNAVARCGAKIVIRPGTTGISSTSILEKIDVENRRRG